MRRSLRVSKSAPRRRCRSGTALLRRGPCRRAWGETEHATREPCTYARKRSQQKVLFAAEDADSNVRGLIVDSHFSPPRARQTGPGEYIVDLCWTAGTRDSWDDYAGLLLAIGVRMGGTHEKMREDFCKLADVAADRRVFIGSLHPPFYESRAKLINEWSALLARHRHLDENDAFIVVLAEKSDDELYDAWILYGDGRVRDYGPTTS